MALSQGVEIEGIDAIVALLQGLGVELDPALQAAAMRVMEAEGQQFAANTPLSDEVRVHMRHRYEVLPLADGSLLQNLAAYAGLVVVEGAPPHAIPHAFGYAPPFGEAPDFHPGFAPNVALHDLWTNAPEALAAAMETELAALFETLLAS